MANPWRFRFGTTEQPRRKQEEEEQRERRNREEEEIRASFFFGTPEQARLKCEPQEEARDKWWDELLERRWEETMARRREEKMARIKWEEKERARLKRQEEEWARFVRWTQQQPSYQERIRRMVNERCCLKQHTWGPAEREQEQHIVEGQRPQQSTPGREAQGPQTTRSCSSLPKHQPPKASGGPWYCTSIRGSPDNHSLLQSSGHSTDQPGPKADDCAIQTEKSPQARHQNTLVGESGRSGLSSAFLSGVSSASGSVRDPQSGYSRGQSSPGLLSQGSVTGNALPSKHCDETMLKTVLSEYVDQEHGAEHSQNEIASTPQAEYCESCKGTHSGSEGDLNRMMRNTTRRTQGEFFSNVSSAQEQFQRNISSDRLDATAVTNGGFVPGGHSGHASARPTQQSPAHAFSDPFLGAENRDEFSGATGCNPQEATGDRQPVCHQQIFHIGVVNNLSFITAPGPISRPHESFLFGNGYGVGQMQEPQVQQYSPPARGAQRERQSEQPSFSFRTPVQCSEE